MTPTRLFCLAAVLFVALPAFAAKDVPVPSTCTAAINQPLAQIIASKTKRDIDNIMVCGVATAKSRLQPGGPHGNHHVITIDVPFSSGHAKVQVVTNDSLDGVVTAAAGDKVFAYGQAYVTHGLWVAGVHDVHCSTHPTADNGWVVVNGVKYPPTCPAHR